MKKKCVSLFSRDSSAQKGVSPTKQATEMLKIEDPAKQSLYIHHCIRHLTMYKIHQPLTILH